MAITTRHTAEYQSFMTPSVDGGFGISWIKWMADGVTDVLYNTSDSVSPPLIIANGYAKKESPDDQSLARLNDGSTVITWVQDGENQLSDQFHSVVGAVVTDSGQTIRFDISDWVQDPLDLTASQSVTALANGNFAVTWQSVNPTNASTSIKSGIFHFGGATVSPVKAVFTISGHASARDHSGSMPATTALPHGGYAVAWVGSPHTTNPQPGLAGPDTIHIAVIGNNGKTVRADTRILPPANAGRGSVDSIRPAITALDNGGFVVTWEDHQRKANGSTSTSISAEMFNAKGIAMGRAFTIATPTGDSVSETSVAGLSSGGFVVTWTDHSVSGTGDSWNIIGQEFRANGKTAGGMFTVNDPATTGEGPANYTSSVIRLTDGSFVVSWTTGAYYPAFGIDDTNPQADIHAQVFAP